MDNMATCKFWFVTILLALVAAVFPQSYPRFEFSGTVLANNSYIRRGLIGIGPNNSLHCVTDNSLCCNNGEGNWYNYTGSIVQQGTNGDSDLYVTRGDGVVYLNRMAGGSSGMWRCDIPDSTGTQQSIYVYLGTLGDKMQGRLTSSVISFTLDSEPNEDPPEFTLTCRSEGGPATTVEWRRNGEIVQEDSNHMTSQIIVDPSRNAVYNNTLRVRGREEGRYKCNVSNHFQDFITNTPPSVNISTFLLFPSSEPTQFNATYKSLTNIVLEWTYDIPISTGYTYVVFYQQSQMEGGGHFNVSFNINKNADNMYKYSLTDIPDGNVYGISIVATRALSPSLPSPVVGPITPSVEAPSVSLSEDGSRVVGNTYTLTCRVTFPEDVQPDEPPTIQWQTPQSASYTEAISTSLGCSCISTITLNSLQETDEGDYVCTASYVVGVFQSPTIMATISVTVLPPLSSPTVSVRAEGSAVAGSNDYTLVCDITIPAPASGPIPIVTVKWTFPSGHNEHRQSSTTGHHNYYSTLPLTPLAHDKEGNYTCNAVYMVDGATSPTASNIYHVVISVGHNDVSVEVEGSGSGVVGSLYTLTCTVTLSGRPASGSSVSIQWQGPAGLSHSNDDDTTDNRVVVSQLALDPLTLEHGGDYTCTAEYTVNGQTITESEEEELFIIIPDPSVMVTASDEVILVGKDIEIYCDIDLIGVTLGRDIGIDVTWFRGNVILTNHPRVTISGLSGDSTDVHITLTLLSVLLSDMATYGCHVTLTPLLGSASPATASDFLLLVVSEPVNPIRPEQVMVRNIKANSAIIQWTVAYISYSPETYIVQYGTSEAGLNQNTSAIYTSSGNDTTITSTTYVKELSGLRGNTIYYVQVVATNTAKRSNTSTVRNFTTLSLMAEDESGQVEAGSPAGVVAACVTVVIFLTVVIALSVFWCKYKHSGQNKYSFAEGKLATSIPGGSVDRERDSGKAEEIEIASVAPTEEGAVETQDDVTLEETDDYFQAPTAIMPAIEPVSIDRFPDYVRDMLQNKESKLKAEFMTLAKLPQPPSTVAVLPHNKEHNRFNNIYPYDKSRVCLTEAPGVKNSDYINASFIDGYGGRKNAYIAAQGPVETSVERFWRMVWEYKLQTIVMLTQCTEAGKIKCVCYWPEKLHDSVTVDEKVRVTYSSNMPFAEYEFRKFKLENLTEPDSRYMTVNHLHYTAWPDHGVPENVMSLIAFIRHLRKLHPVSQPQPLLVHCSAGVGRTGTLILLDIVMQQMKAEGCIGVHHWLRMMRMQRMKMVQSQQQYEFIHCGLSEFVVCGETEVAAADLRITTKDLEKTADHGMTGFQKQLQIIDEVSSHYTVSYADAKQEYNKTKNRFPDKLPNDMYRVRLRCGPQPGSDYINASFISGYKQKRAYIAAQCPLKSTVADFWRMVNEFQCGCVIMLCELEEEGQESNYRFWPKEEGDSEVHGKLTVNLQSVKTLGDIVTRHLNMVDGSAALNQAKRVTMLQLTSWPMKGLPHTSAILSLIEKLTAAQMKSTNKRTIVMCSDGMSRTGTFLTIHSQIERLKTEGVVDFLQAIKSARLQRAGLVLNADHYAFCHEVLNTYLDNFDTYANFVEFKEVI